MNVTLSWVSRNDIIGGTRIYRSESRFDASNLPTPIATVGPGINKYTDTTIVRGKLYYYRFGAFIGNDMALSNIHTVYAVSNTGPGPQKFYEGDHDRGYFGSFSGSDFINGSALAAEVGLTEGTVENDLITWHKFAYKGRILFIPQAGIRKGVSWNQLYNRGLVYGLNGPGPYNSGTSVDQNVVVNIKGHSFRVRLPKCEPYGDYTTLKIAEAPITKPSEVQDLIYNLAAEISAYQKDGNWLTLTSAELGFSGTGGGRTILQEVAAANSNNHLNLGSSTYGIDYYSTYSRSSATTANYWRPVLELIPF